MLPAKYVVWFKDVDKEDIGLVGEKGANLGELTQAGFPVPPGFIVTSFAYYHFLKENDLETKIKHLLGTIDYENPKSLEKASKTIKKYILLGKMSDELIEQIISAYEILSGTLKQAIVAIMSSATVEDLPNASFTGQQETYVNVKGEANVLLHIKDLWASLFDAQVIFYRHEQKHDHFKVGLAIPVQKMVESEKSGIMFTLAPETSDKTLIVIEAILGLHEPIGQRAVVPDHYEVSKSSLEIVSKQVNQQKKMLMKKGIKNKEIAVKKEKQNLQKISDEEITALVTLGKKIEKYYYFPQSIEWIIEKGEIFLIKTHPITNLKGNLYQTPHKDLPAAHTATKVYVNLSQPDLAEKVAKRHVDGIGLLRGELLMANIGVHPKKMIHDGKAQEYIMSLAQDLEKFCKSFSPRPVVYQTSDFKTNEYRDLIGGKEFEPVELNPLLGFRGTFRYIHDPQIFQLEIEAIKYVRDTLGFKNLWLMLPFVRTVEELVEVKKIVTASGLYRSSSFKLWMMVEIPSNVILLDKFIEAGIDGVSFGSNDLTMLLSGIDRDNNEVSREFNEQNDVSFWAFEKIIKTAHAHHITSSFCEYTVSQYPTLLEKLISWGITSISATSDVIESIREDIALIEKKIIE